MKTNNIVNKLAGLLVLVALLLSACSTAEKPTSSSNTSLDSKESAPSLAHSETYSIPEINQSEYKNDDSYIIFENMPKTDAEKIVSTFYISEITGEYEKSSQYYFFKEDKENGAFLIDENFSSNYQWIKIETIQEMGYDKLKEQNEYAELFEVLYTQTESELAYDMFVQNLFDEGIKVVLVEEDSLYTQAAESLGPQISDGQHRTFWLLTLDENGNLKIVVNTSIMLSFSLPLDKSTWPTFFAS